MSDLIATMKSNLVTPITMLTNVKKNGVLDGVMDIDLTEYYSNTLADAVNEEKVMTGSWLKDPGIESKERKQ